MALLYRDPVIPTHPGCMLLLRTLVERPGLAAHVRWLSLLDLQNIARNEGKLSVDDRLLPRAFIQRYDELAVRSGQSAVMDKPSPEKLDHQTCTTTILSFLPNLRKTHLGHFAGQVGGGLLPHSLLNLDSVELFQYESLSIDTTIDLHQLAEAAPNITTLTLKSFTITGYDPVKRDGEGAMFANVRCLCLVGCLITAARFGDFMKSFPRAEQLDFLRPKHVYLETEFTDALAQYNPHLRDLRVQFIDQRRNVMKFGKELAKLKKLQRLWVPFSCFVGAREDFNPESFVQGLPNPLQHLSMILTLTVEDLMSQALRAVAADASHSDARLAELRSVVVSGWDFDVGNSGPTSRSFEIEEAMVQVGRMMDAKGIRLTVEGGIANLSDHYMGFERVVRRYAFGDKRETEKDEDLMKGHSLGEWGTMERWCRRRR